MNLIAILFYLTISTFASNNYKLNNTPPKGGVYKNMGIFSIAVNHNSITGVQQYYDKWNSKYKEFIDINVFYFSGKFINDSTAEISVLESPLEMNPEIIKGVIVFRQNPDRVYFKLENQPYQFAYVDFTEGFELKLIAEKNWIEVRIIKSVKARLYSAPYENQIRKGYLVKEDYVKVIEYSDGFAKIEYNPYGDEKSSFYWVKISDLK